MTEGPSVDITVPDPAGGADHRVSVHHEGASAFAARLFKRAREARKQAKREKVSCYRIYDADIPEYAVAVDLYEGADADEGKRFVHVAEYKAPAKVDPERARQRMEDVLAIVPVAFGVPEEHVFSKVRSRAKGGSQYSSDDRRAFVTHTREGSLTFEVDLSSYLDTGIFLDHRDTRARVGRMAQGKRFLNLFAYTGTCSAHAAAGGAASTVTVDLSNTYLDWARRNMELNGFTGPEHTFERADVLAWLKDAVREGRTFDLIFVDPPTFSNSKGMGERTWDVQRDHVELLSDVVKLLAPDGVAVFSNNNRSFKPDYDRLAAAGVDIEDITDETIPWDFRRNAKIHHAYLVRRA